MENQFPYYGSTVELFEKARAAYQSRFHQEAPVKEYTDDNYFRVVAALELNEPLPGGGKDAGQADD